MPTKLIKLTIDEDADGSRLDRCLSQLIRECSRSFLQKMIHEKRVRCDGEICENQRMTVHAGMELEVELDEPEESIPLAENIDLPVIYEDMHILVINKPPGMVVHPAAGNRSGTVVNALLGRDPNMADQMAAANQRPGIIHRLDKDTSGCLVTAKTPQAQFKLSKYFADRKVAKTYLALVIGTPVKKSGRISTLIGRHPVNRKKMAVVPRNGKSAETIYDVIKSGSYENTPLSMLSVNILTGRTHQIRVHMSFLGHPVLGDRVYGGNRRAHAPRQMLHAWKLKIPHPASGEMMEFEAPLPDDFQEIVQSL